MTENYTFFHLSFEYNKILKEIGKVFEDIEENTDKLTEEQENQLYIKGYTKIAQIYNKFERLEKG